MRRARGRMNEPAGMHDQTDRQTDSRYLLALYDPRLAHGQEASGAPIPRPWPGRWGAREREVAGEREGESVSALLGRRCLSPRMRLGRHPVPIYKGPVAKIAELINKRDSCCHSQLTQGFLKKTNIFNFVSYIKNSKASQ